jgi:NAD/NADP transhydrogenase beta subunit
LIGLAFVDIALRLAALVTIGYIIWGGIQFVIAQGEADRTKKARQTIINALIGLIIALIATAMVVFIGSRLR